MIIGQHAELQGFWSHGPFATEDPSGFMIPWIQGQLVDVAVDAAAKYKKEGPQVRHFTLIHVTQLTPSRLK